jgi:hypothetical protein
VVSREEYLRMAAECWAVAETTFLGLIEFVPEGVLDRLCLPTRARDVRLPQFHKCQFDQGTRTV